MIEEEKWIDEWVVQVLLEELSGSGGLNMSVERIEKEDMLVYKITISPTPPEKYLTVEEVDKVVKALKRWNERIDGMGRVGYIPDVDLDIKRIVEKKKYYKLCKKIIIYAFVYS